MANRFWVGGTGNWDASTQTHWSTVTGPTGDAPQTPPAPGDVVTFDANSGGGTCTIATNIDVGSIQAGSYTNGTLNFATNNNSVNCSSTFGFGGTVTRTVTLGSNIFTVALLSCSTTTGLTFTPGTAVFKFFNATSSGGGNQATGLTYSKFIIGRSTTAIGAISLQGTFAVDFLEFDLTNPGAVMQFQNTFNLTVNNSFQWKGTPTKPIGLLLFQATSTGSVTLGAGKVGFIEWANIHGISFTGGGTFIARNCFDGGGNSGITFAAPQTSAIGAR